MKRFFLLIGMMALLAVVSIATVAQDEDLEGNFIDIATHPYAAFLESDLYAIEQGATAEFRKMEWVAIDEDSMTVYIAMSEVARGMSDGEGDINVEENLCGIVYAGQMDENMVVSELVPLIQGGPYDENAGPNECALDNISEPDGLFVDAMGRLWIGEDTGNHLNNMIWVYDPADGSLTRFGYTPLGAEVTGLFITDEGTVFFNVQHPSALNIYPFNASVVGVVTGFNAYTDSFEEIAVPEGDAQLVAGVAAGEYQVLARNGDPIPGDPFGNAFGQVIRFDGSTQFFCNNADGNMFLPLNEAQTVGYLYSNQECTPGGVSRLTIQKNEDTTWTVLDGELVDFQPVNGTWINCGSSVTPWNTGLTSEEYPSFAGDFGLVSSMSDYLGRQANPYDYGYAIELSPRRAVGNNITKHFAMGRTSWEMGMVAPDSRTVYIGNDGTDRVLFRFVADEAGDLGCGTLYAAAVTQNGEGADHTFSLEWLELGNACNGEIEDAIRELDPE
jgi:secreted PhoX family phosphatase